MKKLIKFVLKYPVVMRLSLICLILVPSFSHAQSKGGIALQQPGYYRMMFGDAEVTALSDGTLLLDPVRLLSNAKPGEIDQLLKQNYLTTPIETSVNAYLIKTGSRLILIDAGTAEAFGPTLGKLTRSLNNAGYKPEQIDAVLVTHIHPDHIGGLMEGDRMVFPNATIYISQPELDFWMPEENKNKAPEGLKYLYQVAAQKVGPYLKAGKVKTFTYGTELFPGITPVASPGHTPGHTFYALESKGQKLMFLGDFIHMASIQLSDPSVTIEFDIDQKAAAIQRKKTLSDAAANRYWIAAGHVSFPGIGHIRSDGSKYIWLPVNYSAYVTSQ